MTRIKESTATNDAAYLNLHGRGVSSTKPDYFSIRFEIRANDPDEAYAYRVVVGKAERMLKALSAWKKEHDLVRTTSFEFGHYMLSERQGAWPKGKMMACVSTTIHVESGRIDDIAGLIALARENEMTEISDVTYRLSDSLRRDQRQKALIAAVDAARFDAGVMAQAFGVRVLGLDRVSIMNGFSHDTYSDKYTLCDSEYSIDRYGHRDADEATEFIEAGEIRTSVGIDAVFRLSRNEQAIYDRNPAYIVDDDSDNQPYIYMDLENRVDDEVWPRRSRRSRRSRKGAAAGDDTHADSDDGVAPMPAEK